ncbi:Peptidylprolyl isomerase [Alishewanella agri BL06]|jgi:FKBP-type peptidyl-prolyl cis-trans isomerase FklB|uniref:Peptidyl-prolyl cis-trans isomerase n=3 Tax=Alishewanella TaxID=111142 RepID=I9P5V7_9ALTE|nr:MULTISPECIES: FKBP-type peptidyl-prolyl cis-trans isomerase [Alishewanella]EHR42147.1 Peptidylprolyl isomerase [Alishewanella jeotgali KCTC 22429]EIW90407.1 Peptidylprolyl isomerase [Alishewanella agri BL06]EJI84265.1 Peptidylprolyl isomerase [Alishewanella aestuarii B11]OZB43188.1 MAG: peptidylprolyl isomerase [Alishewanella sp. 34-51-39]
MSKFTTLEQHASYGIGLQMGQQLADRPFDGLDITAVAAGLAAAYNEQAPEVSDEQIRAAFTVISQRMQAEEQEKAQALAEAGEMFLAENAKRPEVTVTASGLQYEVLVAAEGDKPTAASTVRTHYHGTLIDGTVFDSSYQRGEPAEFPVSGVIAGWTEALQLMAVGSKLRLYIPHNLAYGERGAGNAIAPFSTLVFDVELLAIL